MNTTPPVSSYKIIAVLRKHSGEQMHNLKGLKQKAKYFFGHGS